MMKEPSFRPTPESSDANQQGGSPVEASGLHGRGGFHVTPEGTLLAVRDAEGGIGNADGEPIDAESFFESLHREYTPEEVECILSEFERFVEGSGSAREDRNGEDGSSDTPVPNMTETGAESGTGVGSGEAMESRHHRIRELMERHPGAARLFKAALVTLTLASPAGAKDAEAGVPVAKIFNQTLNDNFERVTRHVAYDMTDFDSAYREAQWRAQEWMRRKEMSANNIAEAIDIMTVAERAFQRNLPALERKFDSRLADIRTTYDDRIALERDPSRRSALKDEWRRVMVSERERAADGISRMENDLRSLKSSMMENIDRNSLSSESRRLQVMVDRFAAGMDQVDAANADRANASRQHLRDELSRYGVIMGGSSLPPVAPRRTDSRETYVTPPVRTSSPETRNGGTLTASDQQLFESMRGGR